MVPACGSLAAAGIPASTTAATNINLFLILPPKNLDGQRRYGKHRRPGPCALSCFMPLFVSPTEQPQHDSRRYPVVCLMSVGPERCPVVVHVKQPDFPAARWTHIQSASQLIGNLAARGRHGTSAPADRCSFVRTPNQRLAERSDIPPVPPAVVEARPVVISIKHGLGGPVRHQVVASVCAHLQPGVCVPADRAQPANQVAARSATAHPPECEPSENFQQWRLAAARLRSLPPISCVNRPNGRRCRLNRGRLSRGSCWRFRLCWWLGSRRLSVSRFIHRRLRRAASRLRRIRIRRRGSRRRSG